MFFQVVGRPFFGVRTDIEIVERKIKGVENAPAKDAAAGCILIDTNRAADQDIFGVIHLGISKVHDLNRGAIGIFDHGPIGI